MTELREKAKENESHTAIEIHGLSKASGNFYAVRGLNLQVPKNFVPELCTGPILDHDLTVENKIVLV